ncbi:MAG TPA: S8 family serine peptidase, partial [Nitrospiria bacterium]|nr:S8 family serine peptidase [Nitrospiria bacterium]
MDIRSTEAWTLAKGKPGMIIAVIDSGIDPRHPDFLNEDLNYNGQLDIDEDTNRNFLLDPGEDFNGNGLLDTNEDINSNKILDAGEDFNGNGVLDTDEDLNQNRVLDPGEDLNGNGEVDTREDINGNGILDPGRIWVNADELPGDHNGDGCPGACGVDDDGDGLVDEDSRGREPGHPDYSGDTVLDDDENGLADDFQGWNFFGNRKCAVVENRCSCESGPSTGNNNVADDFGHGTAVAGVVAGHADNQFGISGVLWDARIMPLKVMDGNGCMTIDDEAAAIDYAVENGAQIIIIASGGGVFQQEEFEAIQRAESAGILVVAPAGNDGSNNDLVPVYPASYDLKNILSIAATDINDGLYFQSNFGVHSVDLGAPGECIYTTLPLGSFSLQSRTNFNCTGLPFQPGFDYVSGTSFAAGFAAGGAGLLLTLNPFISLEELKALILLGVDPVEGLK